MARSALQPLLLQLLVEVGFQRLHYLIPLMYTIETVNLGQLGSQLLAIAFDKASYGKYLALFATALLDVNLFQQSVHRLLFGIADKAAGVYDDYVTVFLCPPKSVAEKSSPSILKELERSGASDESKPIHLKTDSRELYDYTMDEVIAPAGYEVEFSTADLYASGYGGMATAVQTFYESMFLKEGKPITYIKFKIK